jgi:uncharacterized protein YjbI with pentapeptide repeats
VREAFAETEEGERIFFAALQNKSLSGLEIGDVELRHAHFESATLQNVTFEKTVLHYAKFNGVEMKGGGFKHCFMDQVDFSPDVEVVRQQINESEDSAARSTAEPQRNETTLSNVSIEGKGSAQRVNLSQTNFRGCTISNLRLESPEMIGTEFHSGHVQRLRVIGGEVGVTFTNAEVSRPYFKEQADANIEFEAKHVTNGIFEIGDQNGEINTETPSSVLRFKGLSDSDFTVRCSNESGRLHVDSSSDTEIEIESKIPAATLEEIELRNLDGESEVSLSTDVDELAINNCDIMLCEFQDTTIDTTQIHDLTVNSQTSIDTVELHSGVFTKSKLRDGTLSSVRFKDIQCNGLEIIDGEFSGVEFHNATGRKICLRKSAFENCTFNQVVWSQPDLQKTTHNGDAEFRQSSFKNGDLSDASFQGQDLSGINLEHATLKGTDFREANLTAVQIHDAHLESTRINEETVLGGNCVYELRADRNILVGDKKPSPEAANVSRDIPAEETSTDGGSGPNRDPDSSFSDGGINDGSPVDWRAEAKRVADRSRWTIVKEAAQRCFRRAWRTDNGDREDLAQAIRTYRSYQRLLRENALMTDFRDYRVRERHAQRKLALSEASVKPSRSSLTLSNSLGRWLRFSLSRLTMLYGESPWRVITASGLVITVWAGLFQYFRGIEDTTHSEPEIAHAFLENLYFSIVTFTTLGFGDLRPISTTVRFLASIEAVLGAIFTALLVSVLVRRATQ